MDETEIVKSFWNKTTAELTVKDQVTMAVVIPAAMLGAAMGACALIAVGDKVASKFRRKTKIEDATDETVKES